MNNALIKILFLICYPMSTFCMVLTNDDFIEALQRRHLGILLACLDEGIDLQLQDAEGNTALHLAVHSSPQPPTISQAKNSRLELVYLNQLRPTIEILLFLMKKKADLHIKNGAGETPLEVAVRTNKPRLVKLFAQKYFQGFMPSDEEYTHTKNLLNKEEPISVSYLLRCLEKNESRAASILLKELSTYDKTARSQALVALVDYLCKDFLTLLSQKQQEHLTQEMAELLAKSSLEKLIENGVTSLLEDHS